jgi:hypothetical protein
VLEGSICRVLDRESSWWGLRSLKPASDRPCIEVLFSGYHRYKGEWKDGLWLVVITDNRLGGGVRPHRGRAEAEHGDYWSGG